MDQSEIPDDYIAIRKDLLDDSNAAKDEMDKVKKKLKTLLRDGSEIPEQFAWPKEDMPDPATVLQAVVKLMKFHKKIMVDNFARLKTGASSSLAALSRTSRSSSEIDLKTASGQTEVPTIASIQPRWC